MQVKGPLKKMSRTKRTRTKATSQNRYEEVHLI